MRGRGGQGPRGAVGILVASVAAMSGGCGGPHSAFADPASDAAAAIGWLWWVLFGVTMAVFLAVLAGWGYALFRRRDPGTEPEPEGRSLFWIVVAGGLVPALILAGLTVATIRTSARLSAIGSGEEALLVEVVGHQFWWEARYPESGAVTANEIHIPAGRPTRLRLTSNDVIHSLWIPRLHGKLDLTPGRVTELVLRPEEPGIYRGFCAEFCGPQHALMGLRVVAQPPEEFDRWLAENAAPAAALPFAAAGEGTPVVRGAGLFVAYRCNLCHRVRGAAFPAPVEDVGPDLTHVASRETLAALTLENSPGNMAEWIRDPHRFKPGVRMPSTPLSDEELEAMVRYLEALR